MGLSVYDLRRNLAVGVSRWSLVSGMTVDCLVLLMIAPVVNPSSKCKVIGCPSTSHIAARSARKPQVITWQSYNERKEYWYS